jgi:hypothetical protein
MDSGEVKHQYSGLFQVGPEKLTRVEFFYFFSSGKVCMKEVQI